MIGAQYLLTALAREPVDDVRRKARRQAGISLAIGLVGAAATLWLLVVVFLYSWQTDDWQRFQAAAYLPLPFLYLLAFALVLPRITSPDRRPAVQPLRVLLASGDERLAPPAPVQPAPLSSEELATLPPAFNRLRGIRTWWDSRAGFPVWMAILPFLGQCFNWFPQAAGFERQWNQWFGIETPLGIVPMLLAFVPFLAYVMLISRIYRTTGPRLVITADDGGITWHVEGRRPRERRAPWSAGRAFVRTTYASPNGVGAGGTAYLLDLGDTALTWTLTAGSKDDEYLESEALARLIVTRTGQPLRDLSSWMTRIQSARGNVARLREAGVPPDALAEYSALRQRWRRRLWPLLLALVAVFAITFAALFVPGRLEARRFAYLDTLPALVHAETPLYRSSLAADDGNWLVSPSDQSNGLARRVFTGSAYQLSGITGVPVVATMPRIYGDAAVEVTGLTTNVTDDSGFADDNLGLVVRANADLSDMIVITVDQARGEWSMAHIRTDPQGKILQSDSLEDRFRSTNPRFGVHTDGPNTLLILMRGDAFTLYVNGYSVGTGTVPRFGEEPLPIPLSGRVGVYVEDGTDTTAFTNFAIYPLTSPPALNYV